MKTWLPSLKWGQDGPGVFIAEMKRKLTLTVYMQKIVSGDFLGETLF